MPWMPHGAALGWCASASCSVKQLYAPASRASTNVKQIDAVWRKFPEGARQQDTSTPVLARFSTVFEPGEAEAAADERQETCQHRVEPAVALLLEVCREDGTNLSLQRDKSRHPQTMEKRQRGVELAVVLLVNYPLP